ncbi:MAG: hypothetical protein AAF602_10040 [Myxococcota bacterium]
MSPSARSLFPLVIGLAMACQSEPEPVEQPIIPEVPDIEDLFSETADTGEDLVAGDRKYARELRIVGFIGWNALTQQIMNIRIGNQLFISGFEMQLAIADGSNSEVIDDRCSVVVNLTGFGSSPIEAPDEWFRVNVPAGLEGDDIPGGVKEVFSECQERGFTAEQYPEGIPMEDYWASLPWEMAMVTGELDADLEQRLVDSEADPGLYAQGTQDGLYQSGTFGHLTYWRAFEMDEFGTVEGENGQITARRLTRDEMLGGVQGSPPTGYYIFDQLVQWNLPDLIDILP